MAALAARMHGLPVPWKTTLRAMTLTGGSAFASGLLSLLSTKMIAVMLGPAQMAVLGSLQQLRQTATVATSLNGQTGLVQGASALDGEHRREYVRTTFLLMATATLLVTLALCAAPEAVSIQVGLGSGGGELIRAMVPAIWVGTAYVFLTALLNATGAIRNLAKLQLAAPASMALLAYPSARAVAASGPVWFAMLLGVASTLAAAAALISLRSSASRLDWLTGSGRWWSTGAARRFGAISGSLLLSGTVSSWVMMTVRAQILRTEGMSTGGSFDAAWAISMNQAGLVLASLQAHYLPALSRTTREGRSPEICRVLTISAIGGAALIAGLTVWRHEVVALLYSIEFRQASRYLRWTLAGDYLRITSWILSIPMIASANMGAFLTADLVAYGVFAAAAWVFRFRNPAADSAAMAFIAMYAAHLLFCLGWLIARREFRPDLRTIGAWLAGLAVVAGTTALYWETT